MARVQVMTKGHKRFGHVYPPTATEYEIEQDGKKITIWKDGVECRTFKIGDIAEYDSYNLHYLGEVTKISDKAVTIVAYKGRGPGMEKTYRLDLYKFCWRNHKFDEVKIAAENADTMNYI